jgi:hypothetical protein
LREENQQIYKVYKVKNKVTVERAIILDELLQNYPSGESFLPL